LIGWYLFELLEVDFNFNNFIKILQKFHKVKWAFIDKLLKDVIFSWCGSQTHSSHVKTLNSSVKLICKCGPIAADLIDNLVRINSDTILKMDLKLKSTLQNFLTKSHYKMKFTFIYKLLKGYDNILKMDLKPNQPYKISL